MSRSELAELDDLLTGQLRLSLLDQRNGGCGQGVRQLDEDFSDRAGLNLFDVCFGEG